MKIILILLCFIHAIPGLIKGQFAKEYNYLVSPGIITNIVPTIDSGFITAYNGRMAQNINRINFLKVDQLGDTVWTLVLENHGVYDNFRILPIDDSTYIALVNRHDTTGLYKAFFLKFNFFGKVIWNKFIDDTVNLNNNSHCTDIIKTSDNQLAALINSALVKLDTSANIIWTKKFDTYIGTGQLTQTTDSSFVILTYRGTDTCFLSSVDKDGNFKWRILIPHINYGGNLVSAENGSVIISLMDGLLKIDSYGDTIWSKVFMGAGSGWIVKSNHDYIINGINNCNGQYTVLKMDSSGTFYWLRQLTILGNICSNRICKTLDHGFIMYGIKWYTGYIANLFLVKTDSLFNLPCVSSSPFTVPFYDHTFTIISQNFNTTLVQDLVVSQNSPLVIFHTGHAIDYCSTLSNKEVEVFKPVVYPNPFHDQINLSNISEASRFELYNSIGEKILEGNATNDIKVSNLSNGLYVLKITIDERVFTYKLIRN